MFIVLEGLDGAGTTTQSRLLSDLLRARGKTVHETREPSDGPIGVQIRQALTRRLVGRSGDRLAPETIALLFAADRIDHVREEVAPALDAGKIVVSDRYVHSSIAYQGSELPVEWVVEINQRARPADLVVYVEVPTEVCLQRIDARGERELFEKAEFLAAVAERYEDAFRLRADPVVRVDGTRTIEEVHGAISEAVLARL